MKCQGQKPRYCVDCGGEIHQLTTEICLWSRIKMKVKYDCMQQSKHNKDSASEPDTAYVHSTSVAQKNEGLKY